MITALDTNIILDVLIPNPLFLEASRKALNKYFEKSTLIIGEVVYAELATQFEDAPLLKSFLMQTGIRLVSSNTETLWNASRSWKKYRALKRQKPTHSKRVLADFLVGAHAAVHADLFLTRDKGFYRAYFQNLKIEEPH